MSSPRVLDRDGAVLEVGSRVVQAEADSYTGRVTEIAWNAGQGWKVHVHWKGPGITFWASYGVTAHVEPNTYRCPDLLITTAKENQ